VSLESGIRALFVKASSIRRLFRLAMNAPDFLTELSGNVTNAAPLNFIARFTGVQTLLNF
jgi:hypothetical protein